MTDLTIFIATFNRIDTLDRCLSSLERQRRPKRIVIVDNGSQHPAAIKYLDQMEDRYTIYRLPRIEDIPEEDGNDGAHGGQPMQAVQRNLSEAFRRELANNPQPPWFGITDADVHLDGDPASLDTYIHLAEKLDRAIGPHLKLNVHRNYPLRSAALILNARVLFRGRMDWQDGIPLSYDPIDTTFHLFRSGPKFDRLQMHTARVGPPWWATHSDWVIDICNPTLENHAYILGCGEAASWGGRWIRDMFSTYLRSPAEAFALIERQTKVHNDYFYPGFMHSWMLQFGHGCEINLELSKEVLRASFPDWSPCWEYEKQWNALVYEEDFSCLGW